MRRIELMSGISSSALGFGCASILGAVNANTAKRAIHCALDCGINHFDLARSYGYGNAENFVGKILQGKRKEVVICSKFGIKANWKAKLLTPAKPLIRLIKKYKRDNVTGVKTYAPPNNLKIADKFHERIAINDKEMQKSLETSLKELNTDYIDCFFVHEPIHRIVNVDNLLEKALKLKQQGKVRSFGIAFNLTEKSTHNSYLRHFDVLQYNKPITQSDFDAINDISLKQSILFSVMTNNNSGLLSPLEILKNTFADFPKSVILCSTFNTEHIKQNSLIV